jgi:hypothetical protein
VKIRDDLVEIFPIGGGERMIRRYLSEGGKSLRSPLFMTRRGLETNALVSSS